MDDFKFVAELVFPGLGTIDKKIALPNGLERDIYFPIVCAFVRYVDVELAEVIELKKYRFTFISQYPSNFSPNGKVSEMTGIYELAEIT